MTIDQLRKRHQRSGVQKVLTANELKAKRDAYEAGIGSLEQILVEIYDRLTALETDSKDAHSVIHLLMAKK